MSVDRRNAPRAWHPAQTPLVLQILAHNRKIAELMASVARLHGGADLEAAKRKFWERGIEALIPLPGQRPDSAIIPDIVITKGASVIKLKLEAGDVEAAERLAKETGKSFDECLRIYSAINIMNTPSYEGGELIQKGSQMTLKKKLKKQAQQRAELAQFVVNHRMTAADNAVDQMVFKALYSVRQAVGQRPGQPVQSALGLLTGRR